MGNVQADPHALLFTELADEVLVHEQVVEALPTEVPGEGGHRLGNDLHFTSGVELLQAPNQPLAQRLTLVAVEVMVF